jgi:hypothetical protein
MELPGEVGKGRQLFNELIPEVTNHICAECWKGEAEDKRQ